MTERLKQDDILELTVSDDGMAGEGIVRYGDYTLFIPHCIKGERVRAKVTHVRKDNVVFTELKEVVRKSEDRVDFPCNRFTRCGGCDLMHMEYRHQLKIKRDNIIRLLSKNAGLNVEVEEIEPCSTPYGYRNKIQLPFGTVNGRVAMGFFKENSHKIVSITKCFLHGDWAEKLIKIFLDYASEFNLTAYDDNTGRGHLKHLVARYIDGKLSLVLVTDEKNLVGKEYLINRLSKEFPHYSFYQSKKPEKTNVILGKQLIPIKTEPVVLDVMGIKTELNPYSFLQLNSEIRDKIYSRIIEEITEKSNPIVIDAYAGVGVLGAVLAKNGAKVYNVEIVPEATKDADTLAERNSLTDKITNYNGDAALLLPNLINSIYDTQKEDLGNLNIILDPPRKGCDSRVLNALNSLDTPHGLYYISCNPATLTRDLKILKNYKIEYVKPYDMFPQTKHVETLVCLTRN